jgi:dihydrofolate reductase
MSRKIILYIATSLDGYIAKPNDNLDFLSIVNQKGEDYGYHKFIKSVDTILLGRRTYDWVMKQVPVFPHNDKTCYIISRTPMPNVSENLIYTDQLIDLVLRLKQEKGKHVFIDGGAAIVNELLKEKLIDEFIISIIPVVVGNGIRLFEDGRPEQELELLSVTSFEKGLVQLHYRAADQSEQS